MTIGTRYHITDCVGHSYGTAKTYESALTLAKTFLFMTDDDAPENHVVAKFDYDDDVKPAVPSWHFDNASDVHNTLFGDGRDD